MLFRSEKQMELPECVEGNMFTMAPEEMKSRNVERIPETLGDAIEAFDGDWFMKDVLGDHIYTKYLEAKEKEWRDFRAQVTDWEVSEYLYKY